MLTEEGRLVKQFLKERYPNGFDCASDEPAFECVVCDELFEWPEHGAIEYWNGCGDCEFGICHRCAADTLNKLIEQIATRHDVATSWDRPGGDE
jgi:hypothetical protein